MIESSGLSGVVDLVGLGGDLAGPVGHTLEAVAADPEASVRAEEMAGLIGGRIGHFFGQKTFLTDADRAGIRVAGLGGGGGVTVEGAVPLVAMITTAPRVAEYWREIGYPEEVIAGTLVDLGRQVRKTMAVTGRFGFGQADWIEMIWRGGFAQLGRLQFEITRSGLGVPTDAGDGGSLGEGDGEEPAEDRSASGCR